MNIKIECAHDKIVALSKLKPHPANPNKHPESQIALLAKIIQAQGWRNPIVVSNRSGLITKGHARLEAAKLIGTDKAPVDFQDYKDEKSELADMIADNRIAELAEADRSMLRELFEQLDDGAFDTELTGFDYLALEELMTAAPPEEQGENDAYEEWKNMPEFAQENLLAKKSIKLNFLDEKALNKFAKLIGQSITMQTRSIWFPYQSPAKLKAMKFTYESSISSLHSVEG